MNKEKIVSSLHFVVLCVSIIISVTQKLWTNEVTFLFLLSLDRRILCQRKVAEGDEREKFPALKRPTIGPQLNFFYLFSL